MKNQDFVLEVLSPLSAEDVGSVLQPSAQPITKEVSFGSLRVKGSSLSSHPKTFYPMCKRAAFTPPPVDPYCVSPIAQYHVVPLPVAHQMAAPHAVDPILSVLRKFKIALTSFKRN